MSHLGGTVSDEHLYLTSIHPRLRIVLDVLDAPLSVFSVLGFSVQSLVGLGSLSPCGGLLSVSILRLHFGGLRHICFLEFGQFFLV